jgi:SAM-dependent methyltransferase
MTYDHVFYDVIAQGCRDSAAAVVPELVRLFSPTTVVDLGCGEGHWLAAFREAGCLVTGFDGDHVALDRLAIPRDDFVSVDLNRPVALRDPADLALSLEVAEHLRADAADTFVASLVAAAPIVVFSAAIPGQGGAGHINEQWPGYWVERFASHGYSATGALRWRFWEDARVENWYRQNLLVFASAPDTLAEDAFALWTSPLARPWPVVHPVLYDARRS